ncbi:MAG: hypothetical protein BZY80_01455 [SAR202 cluster bacterium Io17-Chloro-G2]|nr:MAG: hypothetical protein BZY80_01455 [SAR202 cluster bacterium Io17-Chloro-G2]
MIFTKSSRKRTEKVSSDDSAISFDLLSNLTYMAALATGGSSRDQIFEMAMEQGFKTGVYFRQVYMLSKRLGYEYVRAFRMVARKAGATSVKNLLLRFGGAITAGVSEADFLSEEARVEREQYINTYYRALETLTKWGDAYAALLVSVSLVVVVAMISSMISQLGGGFVAMLTFSMVAVSSFGVYIIYRTAPVEVKTYKFRRGPVLRRLAVRVFLFMVPAGFALGAIIGLQYGQEYFFLIAGACMFPSGFLAMKENGQIDKIDQEVAIFVRSLGKVTATLGTTVARSLSKIDTRALSTLEPYLKRLDTRLSKGVSTTLCWDSLRDELGSELANRSTRIFVDATLMGGPPEKVGEIAGEYAMDAALMRSRRAVAAMPFAFLTIPLHFAMTGLMVFVLEIMIAFNLRITLALEEMDSISSGTGIDSVASLPFFQSHDMGMLSVMTSIALVSMTVSNALAPKFAMGGHPLNTAFFGGITCMMTGFNLYVIPRVAGGLLVQSPN